MISTSILVRGLFLSLLITTFPPIHAIDGKTIAPFASSALHLIVGAGSFYYAYDTYKEVAQKVDKIPGKKIFGWFKEIGQAFKEIGEANESFFYKLCTLGTVSTIAGLICLYYAIKSATKKTLAEPEEDQHKKPEPVTAVLPKPFLN